MLAVLCALMPVLLIVSFGALMKKRRVLSENTVSELKRLLTNNILPVVIFNALATADLSKRSWIQIGCMMVILFVSFGAGYLVKPLVEKPYRRYVPFMVTLYEGGMIAYPLYGQLCGSDDLYRIAILDVAAILFCFGFYMNVLAFEESGQKANFKQAVANAFRTPAFVAALLGVVLDCSGLMDPFVASQAGVVYKAIVRTISAPLTPHFSARSRWEYPFSPRSCPGSSTFSNTVRVSTALLPCGITPNFTLRSRERRASGRAYRYFSVSSILD